MAVASQRPRVAIYSVLQLLCVAWLSECAPDPRHREALMHLEASRQTGGRLVLSEAERRLSDHLAELKRQEVAREDFPPAMHFFRARPLIRSSAIYRLLRAMPKGGALHVHDFSLVEADWLVSNATYRPHCHACFTAGRSMRFLFSSRTPLPTAPGCSPWRLLKELRAEGNASRLDASILGNLTLFTEEDPEAVYPSQGAVWDRFEQAFLAGLGLVTYAPVFRDYFQQGLLRFLQDHTMYLELRALLPQTYELDGSLHDRAWTLETYQDVSRQFVAEHPQFFGTRVIYTVHRGVNASVMSMAVEEAMKLQAAFPEIMAGFDLVGREDTGRPLWYFREALSLPAERGVKLPFFFHAGETVTEGTEVDQNILDALLFNTSRIGHGFALVRHPVAKELSRKRGVAVEVCPISNQVLRLVSDLRNHPACSLLAEGLPLVVSSDDPALFGASGLSDDFYQAFVGLGGLSSHLGTLKELALNSLRYSSLSPRLQQSALMLWQSQWDQYVSENAP